MTAPLPSLTTRRTARAHRRLPFLMAAAALGTALLAAFAWRPPEEAAASGGAHAQPPVVAFVGANVVPMDRERVIENQTVIVRDGRIAEVGPAGQVRVPAGALRIEAAGKYLLPGLAEMHGHIPGGRAPREYIDDVLFLFVANGVTTVRGMQGHPRQLGLRDSVMQGLTLGPTLVLASPALSGQSVRTVEDARRLVREYHRAGYDLLKVHEGLSPEIYDAIAETARELGIPFGGHVSDLVGLHAALAAGQVTIDHLDNYILAAERDDSPLRDAMPQERARQLPFHLDEAKIPELAAATRRAGAWVVPTMPLWEVLQGASEPAEALLQRPELKYVPPQPVQRWADAVRRIQERTDRDAARAHIAFRKRMLKALADAGVGILLGSDAPQIFNVPGFSIHREMRAMVEAGLTPYQVLESGTRNVALYLGTPDEFGTVAPGRRADLILLEANPLEDVGNVARRAGVMVRGRWLPESEIQARLARIAAAYAAS
ncbi:MAG TPA: amidohydrolase family protein [Longimicrobiales bacterium]